ncbi:hypothetical protein LXL04_033507 [Taraxacum kok-saghyz]
MTESKRTRVVSSCAEEDRISNLAEDLIDSIFGRVPIEDAVRTSILSRKWRYRWTKMRALVFDVQFSNKFAKNGAFGRNGIIRIINQVLFLHNGSILKFRLHIPNISLDSFQDFDQWMPFLSRNGVTEIVLTNSNQRYKLPRYMFCCRELRKLKLENYFFKPPLEFEGFLNLEDLFLMNIVFGDSSSRTQISLPQLKKLSIYECTNVSNFNIKVTKLQCLYVIDYADAKLLRLLHSPFIDHVFMVSPHSIDINVRVERMTLAMLLSNLPKVDHLYFNGRFLKNLMAEKIPKWLPHAVNNLKCLCLIGFEVGDLDQLQSALCLIRNSPNLESLTVTSLKMEFRVIDYDVGPAAVHLQSPNCLDCTLNKLQTVEITSLQGSRAELLFIELLLAHSPSLRKFTITPSRDSDVQKRFDIATDVMQFPRASPKAKMFFLKPDP